MPASKSQSPLALVLALATILGLAGAVSATASNTAVSSTAVSSATVGHRGVQLAQHDAESRLGGPVLAARPDEGWVFTGRNIRWQTQEAAASPVCHTVRPICVHWTNFGEDAPPAADGDGDNIPDQVEQTLAAAGTSWRVIVGELGFRAPLPDRRSHIDGGNAKFDIYLADTGAKNLSGYTSSDDKRLTDKSDYKYRDVSAFMVVDNDFRATQFPNGSAIGNLRVTVAHELSHASQFAYDYKEDRWFSEATATWVEDEVFDDVNLNRRSLSHSPLTHNFT
ncbi:MAG: MXAN_6640 family putative metalloprotease, partial [Candidatus Nanopelagicales bacterium]